MYLFAESHDSEDTAPLKNGSAPSEVSLTFGGTDDVAGFSGKLGATGVSTDVPTT